MAKRARKKTASRSSTSDGKKTRRSSRSDGKKTSRKKTPKKAPATGDVTDALIERVKELGSLQFARNEVEILLGRGIMDPVLDAAYVLGQLTGEAEVRRSLLGQAQAGIPQSTKQYLEIASRRTGLPPSERQEIRMKELDALTKKLVADSPLPDNQGTRALAQSLASLMLRQRELQRRDASGTLTTEEQRSIPAIASNIKRGLADLALLAKPEAKPKGFLDE